MFDSSGRAAEEKTTVTGCAGKYAIKKQKQYFASVLISGVALGGLIASHGRPHVAAVSFSGRSVKIAIFSQAARKL